MSLLRIDRELARHSYYADSALRDRRHEALDAEVQCDVAIVGGGLAGLSAAIELARRGRSVRLLEAQQIGAGASGRNGGQAIHGLACEVQTIEAQLGLDESRRVFGMTLEALDLLRQRCAEFGIQADWRDGYLGVATSEGKARELLDGAEHLERHYGHAMQRIPRAQIGQWIQSPRYVAGVHDPRSGHLHPLKYTLGLARAAAGLGAVLHEDTPVQALQAHATGPATLVTPRGRVRAQQVLLAGNVLLQELAPQIAPQIAPRIMPVGTYIVASAPLPQEQALALIPSGSAVCDNNFVLDYFRFAPDTTPDTAPGQVRMLFGGRVSYSRATPMNLAEGMRQRMAATLPALAGLGVTHAWGGFVDISMNRAPDFGRLPGRPQVYYLQGFSGHGLALTGLAGRLVAEAMAGDAERFDTLARLRHRPFPGGRWLRTPSLVLGMAWYRLKDALA